MPDFKNCTYLILVVLIALFCPPNISWAQAQDVFGKWKTIDDETDEAKSIVEIYQQNGKLYGKIVKLFRKADEDPDPVCSACEGAKNGKKIRGMVIIEGLSKEKDGDAWSGGTILDPAKGKVYKCKIWLEKGQLKVRGYVGIFFRTQTWLAIN